MPMLMLKCKTCGQVVPGTYIAKSNNNGSKSLIALKNEEYIYSRGHIYDYITEDFIDLS